MSVFGTIITARHFRVALEGIIKLWLPDYLAEVAEQSGRARGSLPVFRSYAAIVAASHFVEDQLPCCVTVAPGTNELPVKRTDAYEAEFIVGVISVVSGQDRDATFELAELYTAAVRTLVAHHPSLGGFAESTRWAGERYDDFTELNDSRTMAAGTVQFTITHPQVVDLLAGGPAEPSLDVEAPSEDWGTVTDVEVLVEEMT